MTQQLLQTYKSIQDALPRATSRFVKDYSGVKEDLKMTRQELDLIAKNISPQHGKGPPEDVITSNLSLIYFDTTAAPVSVTMYTNDRLGVDVGWVQVT